MHGGHTKAIPVRVMGTGSGQHLRTRYPAVPVFELRLKTNAPASARRRLALSRRHDSAARGPLNHGRTTRRNVRPYRLHVSGLTRAPTTKEGEERPRGDPGAGDPQGSMHADEAPQLAPPAPVRCALGRTGVHVARLRRRAAGPAHNDHGSATPATSSRGARDDYYDIASTTATSHSVRRMSPCPPPPTRVPPPPTSTDHRARFLHGDAARTSPSLGSSAVHAHPAAPAYAKGLRERRGNHGARAPVALSTVAHLTPAVSHRITVSVYGDHCTGSVPGHGDATRLW
ncbi:hypothetical protein BJ912DRAFT_935651 [Pholiota molesta]|nr:hypothetical protein BJ912DRAFT_935651 [Pholiota molesta]